MSVESQKAIAPNYAVGTYPPNNMMYQITNANVPSSGLSSSASNFVASSSTDGSHKGKPKAVKPPNVFSNDGSFLDRIRRSMKEEEDKRKEKEALERKKAFADRFRMRGKRPPPPRSDASDSEETPEETPNKKQKTGQEERNDAGPQAEYHKAIDSYPGSLKDAGTGVRPLIK